MSYQRDFSRRVRLGIVGVGSHCYRNLLPALHYLPVELCALCDVNRELAEKTAREYGVREVFTSDVEMYRQTRLDGVLLSVGPQLHPQLTLNALDAGVNVWLEKPPAMRAAEVETMLRARGARVVTVGFKKAFMPAAVKARELLAQPGCAPLYSLLGVYPNHIPANGQEVLDKRQYTNWLGNGCHPLSLLVSIAGNVAAVTTHRAAEQGATCILEFTNGALGTLVLAGAAASQPIERYQFFCKGGTIEIEDSEKLTFQRGIPFEYGKSTTFAPPGLEHGAVCWQAQNMLATLENKALFTQGFIGSLDGFCRAILEGVPAEQGSLEQALLIMKVYEAALLSRGGRIQIQ